VARRLRCSWGSRRGCNRGGAGSGLDVELMNAKNRWKKSRRRLAGIGPPRFAESPGGTAQRSPRGSGWGKRVEDDQKAPAGATHGTQRITVNFAVSFLTPGHRMAPAAKPLGQEEHNLYRSSPYDRASLIADFDPSGLAWRVRKKIAPGPTVKPPAGDHQLPHL